MTRRATRSSQVGEVRAQLIVAVVVEAFDGGFLDGAVHPLDLAVGPGMVWLGEPVFDVIRLADHVEAHLARPGGVSIAGLFGELDAIVAAPRRPSVRSRSCGCGRARLSAGVRGTPRPSACQPCRPAGSPRTWQVAVDTNEQVELAFGGLHFGDIHVKEADRVALEALSLRLVALDVGQAGNAVPLEAPMQRRPCQVRDRRLQRIEAVVERQQSVPPECDDRCLFCFGQDRGARRRRPRL